MSVTRERVKKRAIFNDCDVELKPKPDRSEHCSASTVRGGRKDGYLALRQI